MSLLVEYTVRMRVRVRVTRISFGGRGAFVLLGSRWFGGRILRRVR